MSAKDALKNEIKVAHDKYINLGMVDYAGLIEGTKMDARQEKLHEAYRSEVAAIERRYKIAAGQA